LLGTVVFSYYGKIRIDQKLPAIPAVDFLSRKKIDLFHDFTRLKKMRGCSLLFGRFMVICIWAFRKQDDFGVARKNDFGGKYP
jgi:hypothetical protein